MVYAPPGFDYPGDKPSMPRIRRLNEGLADENTPVTNSTPFRILMLDKALCSRIHAQ
jgi:hypothetical protein